MESDLRCGCYSNQHPKVRPSPHGWTLVYIRGNPFIKGIQYWRMITTLLVSSTIPTPPRRRMSKHRICTRTIARNTSNVSVRLWKRAGKTKANASAWPGVYFIFKFGFSSFSLSTTIGVIPLVRKRVGTSHATAEDGPFDLHSVGFGRLVFRLLFIIFFFLTLSWMTLYYYFPHIFIFCHVHCGCHLFLDPLSVIYPP